MKTYTIITGYFTYECEANSMLEAVNKLLEDHPNVYYTLKGGTIKDTLGSLLPLGLS